MFRTLDVDERVRKAAFRTLGEDVRLQLDRVLWTLSYFSSIYRIYFLFVLFRLCFYPSRVTFLIFVPLRITFFLPPFSFFSFVRANVFCYFSCAYEGLALVLFLVHDLRLMSCPR